MGARGRADCGIQGSLKMELLVILSSAQRTVKPTAYFDFTENRWVGLRRRFKVVGVEVGEHILDVAFVFQVFRVIMDESWYEVGRESNCEKNF